MGHCTYLLRIPPAQSVTAVAEKNDGSWVTLDAGDWSAVEVAAGEPRRELIRESGWWKPTLRGEASVRVSGVFASTATAPPEIAMASLILAHRLVNRPNAPFGIEAGGIETGAMYVARNDPDVYTLLKRRRRVGFGRRSN